MENLRLAGKIEPAGTIEIVPPIATREQIKNLFKDESGKLWLGKKIRHGDEHIREFIGRNLILLLNDFRVTSPRIAVHQDYRGYLVEYLQDMNPRYYSHDGTRPRPEWLSKDAEMTVGYSSRPVTDRQIQHIAACFINDDFDRHIFNYGFLLDNLVVLDQSGEVKGSYKEKIHFAGNALYCAELITSERRRQITLYQPAINVLQSSLTNEFIYEMLSRAEIPKREIRKYRSSLMRNLNAIERTLERVFEANRRTEKSREKEKRVKI
jgi:hypothetical protein